MAFTIGFIGAGGIAHQHASNLKRIAGVELVCASDISASALADFTTKQGVARSYADYREMLAQERDVEAICVCTPNAEHTPNTIAALQAGKHVLVEKPMAMSVEGCRAMISTAAQARRQLVVGFQYRFDGRTQLIRRQVDDGAFGKVLHVRCQALRRRGIPNWGVFGRKDLQGGGPMIDIGVHVIEMAHYAMGSPKPRSASGNTWTYLGDRASAVESAWKNWDWSTYTVEDLAVGLIRFENGSTLSIEASFAAHIEKDVWNFTMMAEKGGASWDPVQVFTDQNGYMFTLAPAFVPNQGWDAMWAEKMKHFVEVCRDGRTNLASGDDGLMVQQMLDGVYRSAASKQEVSLSAGGPTFGLPGSIELP
jgi:predicted dehydrogenase